jgi:hypothetical protein
MVKKNNNKKKVKNLFIKLFKKWFNLFFKKLSKHCLKNTLIL